MKNLIKSVLFLALTFLISNCGESGSSDITNKYLGKAPGFAKNYKEKIAVVEREGKDAKSLAELEDYDKQRKLLKKEAAENLEQLAKSLKFPITIPFEVKQEDEKYKVNNLKITNLMYNQIELTAEITAKATRSHLFGFLQALDAQGNPLQSNKDWVVLDVIQWRNVKEGQPAIMKGYFRGIEKLGNLEKFVFKSREEYAKK